jgi:hypothetical protein
MPALSPVKKESVGLGSSRMGTKKTKLQKLEDHVHGSATKNIETYCYSEIFFLEILINVKAGRVN